MTFDVFKDVCTSYDRDARTNFDIDLHVLSIKGLDLVLETQWL